MPIKRVKPAPAPRDPAAVRPAAVVALGDDPSRVHVRLPAGASRSRAATARLALAAPCRLTEGDRVLVAGSDDDLYVIGVLHAAAPPSLSLPDGASVTLRDGAAEIRDPGGRLLVRYADGAAEIAAPAGDLTLSAPEGNIVLRSGRDIDLEAQGDLRHRAACAVETTVGDAPAPQLRIGTAETRVRADRLDVETREGRLLAGRVSVIAERITTTASVLSQQVERFELTATRLIEKTRDTFRDASDLAQTRVGRARVLVRDMYSMHARRTSIASSEDTSIDGKKILIG